MTLHDVLGKTVQTAGLVSKGWGYEKILVNNECYCGKLLHMVAGHKCSIHYHKKKHETFYLHKGKIDLFYHDDAESLANAVSATSNNCDFYDLMEHVVLVQGQVFTVPIGRVHQMLALEDSELFEFSTHDDPEDSYRLLKGD